MSSRLREIASSALGKLGIPGIADIHILTRSGAYAPYSYWEQWAHANNESFHTDIETALGKMTTGRNDVLLISPDSHSQADSITWSKNMTHLVGMYPPTMISQRSRIGHSANFDKLLDITGYGNLFANFELQYGRGSAANLTCCQITGNRNTFKNVHFGAPFNATEADQATFKVIGIAETSGGDGLEHYFDHCTIGADTIAWTNGDMIKYSGTPRMVFEDCQLIMRADNAQVTFMDGTAGDGAGFVIFKNCILHNFGTSLTVGFGSTGLAATTDILLAGSTTLGGATDVIAAADEAQVFIPARVGVTEDIYAGLSINPDHTA